MPVNSHAVFISYRRNDTDGLAGRLRDRIEREFPDGTVFMDVNSVRAGFDFRSEINAALRRSSIFLLLIGDRWLNQVERLLLPEDTVLHEIRLAIALDLHLVPVLVNGAIMPNPKQLPEEIRSIAWLNAVELRHSRFEDDCRNLMSTIQEAEGVPNRQKNANYFKFIGAIIAGALIAIAIGLAALVFNFHVAENAASDWIGDVGAALLLPLLALIGGAAGFFFSRRRDANLI
jgi:hypothetical protein